VAENNALRSIVERARRESEARHQREQQRRLASEAGAGAGAGAEEDIGIDGDGGTSSATAGAGLGGGGAGGGGGGVGGGGGGGSGGALEAELRAAVVEGELASCRERLSMVESVLREWQAHAEALTERLAVAEASVDRNQTIQSQLDEESQESQSQSRRAVGLYYKLNAVDP
jgi:hypothetical protein